MRFPKLVPALLSVFLVAGCATDTALSRDPAVDVTNRNPQVLQAINEATKSFGGLARTKLASERGDPAASYAHGLMLWYGLGDRENKELALEKFRNAAASNPNAALFLAKLNLCVDDKGCADDFQAGFELLRASAKSTPEAMYMLGRLYVEDERVVDLDLGISWLNQAANAGFGRAKVYLEKLSETGEIEDAFTATRENALQGSSTSMRELAKIYLNGVIVPRNVEKAKRLLEDAHYRGDGEAKRILDGLSKESWF